MTLKYDYATQEIRYSCSENGKYLEGLSWPFINKKSDSKSYEMEVSSTHNGGIHHPLQPFSIFTRVCNI